MPGEYSGSRKTPASPGQRPTVGREDLATAVTKLLHGGEVLQLRAVGLDGGRAERFVTLKPFECFVELVHVRERMDSEDRRQSRCLLRSTPGE